jgi:hypothetical protein
LNKIINEHDIKSNSTREHGEVFTFLTPRPSVYPEVKRAIYSNWCYKGYFLSPWSWEVGPRAKDKEAEPFWRLPPIFGTGHLHYHPQTSQPIVGKWERKQENHHYCEPWGEEKETPKAKCKGKVLREAQSLAGSATPLPPDLLVGMLEFLFPGALWSTWEGNPSHKSCGMCPRWQELSREMKAGQSWVALLENWKT